MPRRKLNPETLRAAGWRQIGTGWCPPWQSPYSYTLRAALLEQALVAKRTRKPKRITPLEVTP